MVRLVKGDKVCLEPFSYKRLLTFYSLYKDSRQKWEKFVVLHFRGIDDVKKFIAQQTQNDAFIGFFILNKKSFRPIGFILGDEISDTEVSVTRAISQKYEGRGYAYEARQLFEQLLSEAGYSAIVSFCDTENTRSRELLLRDGYIKEDTTRISLGPVSMEMEKYRKCL